ncbi:MAG: DMT family transporter [Ruminococcaceae bacterium]|nr:DMT family transporter [Oscillospiraceae bacterium]
MEKNKIFTNVFFVTAAAILCCALWGSATPFIKIGYSLMLPDNNTESIMLFAGIRFFLAVIITVMIYSVARRKFLFPKRENLSKVATVASFQTVIQYIFFYIGLANTTGVKGTVISGSNTFFAILIASLIFRQEKLTLKKIIACILGFSGIIVVNLKGLDLNMNFLGDGFVLFSTVAYAISSVLMKRYSKHEDPVVISGYQFIMGGGVMILVGFALGGVVTVQGVKAVCVLIYLAFLSAVAYSVWGVLLKHNPVSRVTVFSFMIPVFGVLLSNLLLTENSNVSPANLLVALVLICAGITILNYNKERK